MQKKPCWAGLFILAGNSALGNSLASLLNGRLVATYQFASPWKLLRSQEPIHLRDVDAER